MGIDSGAQNKIISANVTPLESLFWDSSPEADRILIARSVSNFDLSRIIEELKDSGDRSPETLRLWQTLYMFAKLPDELPSVLYLEDVNENALERFDGDFEIAALIASFNERLANSNGSSGIHFQVGDFLRHSKGDLMCTDEEIKVADAPSDDFMKVHTACHNFAYSDAADRDALLRCLQPFVFRFSGIPLDELASGWDTSISGCYKRIENLNTDRLPGVQAQILVKNDIAQLVPLSSGLILSSVADEVEIVYNNGDTSRSSALEEQDEVNESVSPETLAEIRAFAVPKIGSPAKVNYFKWNLLNILASTQNGVPIERVLANYHVDRKRIQSVVHVLNRKSSSSLKGKFGVHIVIEGNQLVLRPFKEKDKPPKKIPESRSQENLQAEAVEALEGVSPRSEAYHAIISLLRSTECDLTIDMVAYAVAGLSSSPTCVLLVNFNNNVLKRLGFKLSTRNGIVSVKRFNQQDSEVAIGENFRTEAVEALEGVVSSRSEAYQALISLLRSTKGDLTNEMVADAVEGLSSIPTRFLLGNFNSNVLKRLGFKLSTKNGIVSVKRFHQPDPQ